ncbi:MAG: beta-N-acetylhexosaminidase [Proteobacteria bacterium]|nr:beta-N-acetylhexosaminidase [Pseudomonadota bacterium]
MSLGPIMCDLRGLQLEDDEREMLMHPHIGGVILFTRNYESPEQLEALTASIHELRQPHLLIAVDHEGGRVQRFREGFSRLPACELIGCLLSEDAKTVAEQAGWLMAAELLATGIDLSFAPVLDVGGKTSQVIGDRAFHTDPEQISLLAKAYIRGMKEAGMTAVGKHFPGHGSVVEDSHVAIPYDRRSFEDIKMHDLIPFERMINNGLSGLMPAHVIYTEIDDKPAGFSAVWLKHILRKQMGYQGTIFSDDLSMAGAGVMGDYPQRAEAALNAGCDMVLACNNQPGAVAILEKADIRDNIESQSRLIRMHGQFNMSLDKLKQTELWKQRSEVVSRLEKEPELNLGDDAI